MGFFMSGGMHKGFCELFSHAITCSSTVIAELSLRLMFTTMFRCVGDNTNVHIASRGPNTYYLVKFKNILLAHLLILLLQEKYG